MGRPPRQKIRDGTCLTQFTTIALQLQNDRERLPHPPSPNGRGEASKTRVKGEV